jgi:CHRD domain
MRTMRVVVASTVLAVVVFGGLQAMAGGDGGSFSARLSGYEEIPTLSVPGTGRFSAELDGGALRFTLRYRGLTGPAHQAHIHLGRPWVAGGVIAFLCGGGGQDPCPAGTSGTVRGTIRAANVIGPAEQGIAAGEFRELVRALRAGATYANVHTEAFPTGEIRGQIRH